jgi:hypothetical protein
MDSSHITLGIIKMTNMRTSHTTRSIEDYLNDFAGRLDMPGYDDTKPIHIAEENRDHVWTEEMGKEFIKSIFAGFTIPLMTICDNLVMDGGNRSTVLMKWRRNEFMVSFEGWEGTYDAMPPNLSARWNRCVIPMTIITNATPRERSQIYENLNKGIVLTTGQLLKNRKYLPLVNAALFIMGRRVDRDVSDRLRELRDILSKVWKKHFKQTKSLKELTVTYQVLVGSQFGPAHCHTSFIKHLPAMLTTTDADIDVSNLMFICSTLRSVDPEDRVPTKKKEDVFKRFYGAMIYDLHTMPLRSEFVDKWTRFVRDAYDILSREQLKTLVDTGTARASTQSRIQRLSENVNNYIHQPFGQVGDDIGSDTQSDSDSD